MNLSSIAEPVSTRRVITDEEARSFHENGYLVLKGVLKGEEFKRVRSAADELTAYGSAEVREHPDFAYGAGHRTGRQVLRRIEYVINKKDACKVLLGHPFILRSVEKLMGKDLVPTWDSMVLKLPGEGIAVPWHRDGGADCIGDRPIFNVDFYLDPADLDTCLWAVPGSQRWAPQAIRNWIGEGGESFRTEGAIPVPMEPGDVIFHNILVLHGSPPNRSTKQRRVLYYEFRSAHVEAQRGPHRPEYIPLKQKVLLKCLERRRAAGYVPSGEEPFRYDPPPPYDRVTLAPGEELKTYRYPHRNYWRKDNKA